VISPRDLTLGVGPLFRTVVSVSFESLLLSDPLNVKERDISYITLYF